MPSLRVAAAQLNTVVGDLSGNVDRILAALSAAEAAGADICIVPELAITGYPPEDLLLKPSFVADNLAALGKVAAASGQCAIVVGYVGDAPAGPGLSNAAAISAGGRIVGTYRKRCLPNYGVFDEQRWFVAGEETPTLFGVAGAWVGISVCEDVWFAQGPVAQQGRAGADVVVNLNASPYNRGRRSERLSMLRARVAEAGCAIAYVNQVGGQDELVFDGDSLIVAADGTLLANGAQFASDLVVLDIPLREGGGPRAAAACRGSSPLSPEPSGRIRTSRCEARNSILRCPTRLRSTPRWYWAPVTISARTDSPTR